MSHELVTDVPEEDFQQAIQEYIHWASEWDGALPADVFFGAWAELQKEKETLSLKAHIVAWRLQFTAPPDSPVRIVDNRIYLEDGRELIIDLEPTT